MFRTAVFGRMIDVVNSQARLEDRWMGDVADDVM
jgi:hypothetical protein